MYNPLDSIIEVRNSPDKTDGHWQLPSTPLQMEFNTEFMDPKDLKAIAEDLDLDEQELDHLEIYVERTEGQIDYMLVNDIQYQCIEDLPESIKAFLDNIQFGDPENPVITASGARVNFWDALAGEPEVQQAFFESGYEADNDYFHMSGRFDVVDSVQSMEDKQEIDLNDTLATKAINQKVKQYIHQKDTRRKRIKRIVFSLITLALLLATLAYLYPQYWQ